MARTSPRKKAAVDYRDKDSSAGTAAAASSDPAPVGTRGGRASKRTVEPLPADTGSSDKAEGGAKKKRRIKSNAGAKDGDGMPLAARTPVSGLKKAMYVGAHVSAAGGVQNAVSNAVQIGANSFALFLKSQRKWANPALASEARDLFVSGCEEHGFSAAEHALPHGSYLVNLAQADGAKAAQAYDSFVDDLGRCDQLGIRLYNFHPGSTGGDSRAAAIGRIAAQLNKAHKVTGAVVTVLENMAGSGNVIGSTFEDLRDIIALVQDKSRVGVCIDTCHAFAAGYDLRTPSAFRETMNTFNSVIGAQYLKAFHLNDSKAPLGSRRDLHANIGTGFLGLRAFHSVVNEDAFCGMPMVLETPIDRRGADGKTFEDRKVWADEIKLLESLIGMDPDDAHFKRLEEELQAQGRAEREKMQAQADKKTQKKAKKGAGKKSKKTITKRSKNDEDASDDEESGSS